MPKCPNCGHTWGVTVPKTDAVPQPYDPNRVACVLMSMKPMEENVYHATIHKDGYEAEGILIFYEDIGTLELPLEVLLLKDSAVRGIISPTDQQALAAGGEYWLVTDPKQQEHAWIGTLYYFKLTGKLNA